MSFYSLVEVFKNPFIVKDNLEFTHREIRDHLEDGKVIVLDNLKINGFPYEYYHNFENIYTPKNDWIPPVYGSDVKKRDRLKIDYHLNDEQIEEFKENHKIANVKMKEFFEFLFPEYKLDNECLSHRYNVLGIGHLHLDLKDDDNENHQMRMFINLDPTLPRVLTFGPTVQEIVELFGEDLKLYELDGKNPKEWIGEVRHRFLELTNFKYLQLPRHFVHLDPGAIWIFNTHMITHQIIYGRKTICFEGDITNLDDPSKNAINIIKGLSKTK